MRRNRPAEVEVEDPGLDPGDPGLDVDLQHTVHLGRDDHERVVDRGRSAGQPGAAPPGDERTPVTDRALHRVRDVLGRSGEADRDGTPAFGARVAGVERELERLRARLTGAESAFEIGDERLRGGDPPMLPTDATTFRCVAKTTGAVREWVTFQDPKRKKHVWHVDVTFMTSHWSCIFGNGCQGVLTEEAPELVHGCCSYGAHASGPKDQALVNNAAKLLDDDTWQFRKRAKKKGIWVKVAKDDYRTRLVDGACIFLNRPGFATGPGCALHQLAERTGQHHSDLKPEVCWQLPLRNIEEYDEDADDGIVYHRLTEFARHGWGEGGEEFAWWCTEEPAAFVGREPVYRSLEPELRKMCGDELFEMIAEYLDDRLATGPAPVRHPAEMPIVLGPTRTARSA